MAENTNTAGDAITAENNFSDLQRHAAIQDARISNLETKFEMFMQSMKETTENLKDELKDFKDEMRQQNAMRAAENKELRDSIKEIYQTTDAKIAEIRTSIDDMGKHVRNISIAAFVGIGAMVLASGAMAASVIYSVFSSISK